jgi:hypothetical protein
MIGARKRTFGETLYKGYGAARDLDGLLRLHSVLVARAMQDQWRFKSGHIVTGPYETLMGYHNCGSSGGGFQYHYADIAFRDSLETCCERIRSLCLSAMCLFRGFASLDEELPSRSFDHCQSELNSVAKFERSRTRKSLNSFHRRARHVSKVGLRCTHEGVLLFAIVNYGPRDHSELSLFHLMRSRYPKWNQRHGLSTFLTSCSQVLESHCEVRS